MVRVRILGREIAPVRTEDHGAGGPSGAGGAWKVDQFLLAGHGTNPNPSLFICPGETVEGRSEHGHSSQVRNLDGDPQLRPAECGDAGVAELEALCLPRGHVR
jgi:hypothetical protein